METDTLDIKVARIYRLQREGAIIAFVDLSVNGLILIKGFRIVKGPQGLFVTMPQEKAKRTQRWYNTVRCLSKNTLRTIEGCILEAYKCENGIGSRE